MKIEADLLRSKYNTVPTHSAGELELLTGRFPENISLFTATFEDHLVAGVIIYESKNVAHAQYIGATSLGKEVGALDCILSYLITERTPINITSTLAFRQRKKGYTSIQIWPRTRRATAKG
jgi:glycerol-3-phosphate responsive antiterminator